MGDDDLPVCCCLWGLGHRVLLCCSQAGRVLGAGSGAGQFLALDLSPTAVSSQAPWGRRKGYLSQWIPHLFYHLQPGQPSHPWEGQGSHQHFLRGSFSEGALRLSLPSPRSMSPGVFLCWALQTAKGQGGGRNGI